MILSTFLRAFAYPRQKPLRLCDKKLARFANPVYNAPKPFSKPRAGRGHAARYVRIS